MRDLSIKPRLKKCGPGNWVCACSVLARHGNNFKDAYRRWVTASLQEEEALTGLQESAPKKLGRPRKADKVANSDPVAIPPEDPVRKSAKLAEFRKLESSVPAPQLRQPGTAKPKRAGKPIVIKSEPKVAPIEQPKYHKSLVRQMPAPIRRDYAPPVGLRLNQARAAAVQPEFISIAANNRSSAR